MKKSKKTYFYLLLPVVMLTGCLSYEKPPLDPARTAYTALKQENMTQLPENMSHLSLVDAQRMALQNNADFQTIRFALEAAKPMVLKGALALPEFLSFPSGET